MSKSKVKVTRDKNALCTAIVATEWSALAANNVTHQQTAPFRCPGGDIGGLRAGFVW